MSDQNATQEPTTEPARPAKSELKSVRYVGSADVRSISGKDLESAGFAGNEDLSWSADNQYTVPVKGIKADVLDLLAKDSDFVLE